MPVQDVKRGTGQHHGDLRNTLIDVAQVLVAEHGPLGWTMAQASRQAAVSVAAPYKHFRDRDDLLAALAARGFDQLATRLRAAMAVAPDAQARLVRFAGCYVEFAWHDRALFEAAYDSHRDKASYPELMEAAQAIFDLLLDPAQDLVGPTRAPELVIAIGALAHGYAVLLRDEHDVGDEARLHEVRRQAETTVRDLIVGTAAREA